MIQDINYDYEHQSSENFKATTPGTADSFISHPSATQILGQAELFEGLQQRKETTLFSILEQRFQGQIAAIQDPRNLKDTNKIIITEDVDECEIKIGINVVDENGQLIKFFSKTIIKTMQFNDQITLIFDRQHEKLKIDTNRKYIIKTFIETFDGFSKSIWEERFNLDENAKKWSVMTLSAEDSSKCLNMEVEKVGKFFIKPLSFKLPLSTIDQFFDYKFKLLNKSDLLSSLESISQLKGILHPLSRQNMGSRIIQKLLTKANEKQIQLVINQLRSSFKDMIFDRYGNYVFQKIFNLASRNQKIFCLDRLQPCLIDLLKSKEGTHCIQTLLDSMDQEEIQNRFGSFTVDEIFELSTNKFSMHFVQKLMGILSNDYLVDTLIGHFSKLAIDRQGIVVLKYLISICAGHEGKRYEILSACEQCLNQISFTQFGHYIVEEMLLFYTYYELHNIVSYISMYIKFFAENQYSSSIIRKSIEAYGDYITIPIINNLVATEEILQETMQNSCGEFVLHRLMELTQNDQAKCRLVGKMMELSRTVKCYEKRQKWLKFFKMV